MSEDPKKLAEKSAAYDNAQQSKYWNPMHENRKEDEELHLSHNESTKPGGITWVDGPDRQDWAGRPWSAPDNGGLRYNTGKNQVELIPAEWTWALGIVLTRGALKYAIRNWERGQKWSYPVGCIGRHLAKFLCGERYDPESGCHHLAHVAWNALALMSYDIRGIGENDLGAAEAKWLSLCATTPGPELLKKMAEKASAG